MKRAAVSGRIDCGRVLLLANHPLLLQKRVSSVDADSVLPSIFGDSGKSEVIQ